MRPLGVELMHVAFERRPVFSGAPAGLPSFNLGSPCSDAVNAVYPSWGPDAIKNLAINACESVASKVSAADQVLLSAKDSLVNTLQAKLNDLEPLLTQWLGSRFGGQFTRAPKAFLEIIQWLSAVASRLGPLVSPSASAAQKRNALAELDPLFQNSAIYDLFFNPQYERAADAVAVSFFALQAVGMLPLFIIEPQLLLTAAVNLTSQPTPYLRVLRDLLTVARSATSAGSLDIGALIRTGQDFLQIAFGVRVGPATAILVTIEILMGLPVPPTAKILALIAKDPEFRADLKNKGLNQLVVDKGLTALATCVTASDADQFLRCAQKVIEAVLPGLVSNMRRYGVSLSDARVVITQLWRTGGNIALAFDQDDEDGRAATAALMALGVAGLVCLAELVGGGDFISYFEMRIGPIIPRNAADNLRKGIKFYGLLAKVFGQYRPDQNDYALKNPGDQMALALDVLNRARWDLQLAMPGIVNIILDTITRNEGKPLVSPELKLLLSELAADRTFDKLAGVLCDLFVAAGIVHTKCPATGIKQADLVKQSGVKVATSGAVRTSGSVRQTLTTSPGPTIDLTAKSSSSYVVPAALAGIAVVGLLLSSGVRGNGGPLSGVSTPTRRPQPLKRRRRR